MLSSTSRIRRRERGDILFGPMFFVGILAAIAIPAYQDYTIRSQVNEGLNLAAATKASIAEFYITNGRWPANLKEAGFDHPLTGPYVRSVTIDKGTLVIRYGAQASAAIAGHRLTLRPMVDEQQHIIWTCGYGDPSTLLDPASGAAAPHKTSIAPKYLPRSCRG